jgi:hypothetical protein
MRDCSDLQDLPVAMPLADRAQDRHIGASRHEHHLADDLASFERAVRVRGAL